MFNFHTHHEDTVPCLLNSRAEDVQTDGSGTVCSVGLHPWDVGEDYERRLSVLRCVAGYDNVWAIGECGMDKVRGGAFPLQIEVFKIQVGVSEEVKKPLIVHCVKAYDELLAIRKEHVDRCKGCGREPLPWILHGFRGKPEQAKQMMAKGMLLSFSHQYNIDSLRYAYEQAMLHTSASIEEQQYSVCSSDSLFTTCPFFLETDDLRLSVRQIYEQVGRHLGVDVGRLESLCDPRQTVFCRSCQ